MSQVFEIEKDPNSDLDYGFDWSDWLVDGAAIASSEWLVDDGLDDHDAGVTGAITVVWLAFSGTIRQAPYKATNRVTDDSTPPRTDDRTWFITIKQR